MFKFTAWNFKSELKTGNQGQVSPHKGDSKGQAGIPPGYTDQTKETRFQVYACNLSSQEIRQVCILV